MSHLHRLVAVAAAGLLVLTVAGPASAAPDDRGAGWLTRQLTDGLIHNDQYDLDDYGLTADTAYALKAIGGHADDLVTIREALAANVDSWTTGGDPAEAYAGSIAKAVVVAQVTGGDARDFGGTDLVTALDDRVRDTAPVGRLEDKSQYGDYANTIGQSFAVRGLGNAGSGETAAATAFLLKQQCSQGFFRLGFAAIDAGKQGCDADDEASPDTDATALALLNLRALPKAARTDAVKAAIADGLAWLGRRQKDNGSFGGGTATEASNTNSTGLAAWVLADAGICGKARAAAAWVKKLQVSGDVSGTPLAGQKGAIAYDRAAFKAAQADGIGTNEQDQWRRATTQAAPGLSALGC